MTVKISTSNPDHGDTILHELEINKILTKDPSLTGSAFVRAAFDDFVALDLLELLIYVWFSRLCESH